MLKKLLTVVLPIALPFLVYAVYVVLARARGTQDAGTGQPPWSWLVLAGVGLMAATLLGYWYFADQPPPGVRYIPDRYIDGELVPGRTKPPDDPPSRDPGVGMPAN
mgnify:CR=1 FL=1